MLELLAPIIAGVAGSAVSGAMAKQPSIDYGKYYGKILSQQIGSAPAVLQAHQKFDPAYAALDEQLLYQRLFGAPGGSQQEQYVTGYKQEPIYSEGNGRGRIVGYRSVPVYGTRTVQTPGTRGLLDIYEKDLAPAVNRMTAADERARIQGELDTLTALGPEAKAAMEAANPEAAALVRRLTEEANTGLAAGTALTPDMQRQVTESVRRGQMARGNAASPAAAFQEALKTTEAGQALQASRRAFAGNTVALNQGFYGDTYQRFFGRSSGATPTGASFLGMGNNGTRLTVSDPMAQAGQMAGMQYANDASNNAFWRNQAVGAAGATLGNLGKWAASKQTGSGLPTLAFNPFA